MSEDEEIAIGIAAYRNEQEVLLRLMPFTENDFDRWLKGREFRKPKLRPRRIDGSTFLLGWASNGFSEWALWLDLLQHMMLLGAITTQRDREGRIVYKKNWQ